MNNASLFLEIEREFPNGTKLDPDYRVTGIRTSRGENALFYSIPSSKTDKRTQKSIGESEFIMVHQHLLAGGELTVSWLKKNLPKTASQSTSCSFKVIGEMLAALGKAKRVQFGRGHKYVAVTC